MTRMNYLAEAELYPSRRRASGGVVRYRRFDSAALAIKFAIEELPGDRLLGTILEVGDERFGSDAIQQLYDSEEYPLTRDTHRISISMKTSQKSSARRNAEQLMNQAQRRDSNIELARKQSSETLATKTQRLRELRLTKEAADRESAPAASVPTLDAENIRVKRSKQN